MARDLNYSWAFGLSILVILEARVIVFLVHKFIHHSSFIIIIVSVLRNSFLYLFNTLHIMHTRIDITYMGLYFENIIFEPFANHLIL